MVLFTKLLTRLAFYQGYKKILSMVLFTKLLTQELRDKLADRF